MKNEIIVKNIMKTSYEVRTKKELRELVYGADLIEVDVVRNNGRLVISTVIKRIGENYFEAKTDRMQVTHNADTITNLLTDHINDGYIDEIIVDGKKITFGGNE